MTTNTWIYLAHTHTQQLIHTFCTLLQPRSYQLNITFLDFQFSKRKYYSKRGPFCVVIHHDDIYFSSDSSPIIALPCQSLSQSPAVLNFVQIVRFSKLLHVYLWAVAWICQNWYMDFSKLLLWFLKIDVCTVYIHSSNLLHGFESCHMDLFLGFVKVVQGDFF